MSAAESESPWEEKRKEKGEKVETSYSPPPLSLIFPHPQSETKYGYYCKGQRISWKL